ncbi:MAG: hypothetical protein Q8O84_00860, partial [Nanoarchaeota archaeon]|nr:hypothetical protein [Nanoarchaeota archaeon]
MVWRFLEKITGKTTENATNQTCTNECSANGNKQCSGTGYQTCGEYDSDSCLEWSPVTSCLSSETCVQGACVSNTYTCTDSDGGKTYSTKGNVVASSPTSSIDVTDLCSDSTRVVEYFCNPDKTQSGETYTCSNGCSNGACISSATNQTNATNTCSDSDGGKNYNTRGTINVNGRTESDSCRDGGTLYEWFCGVEGDPAGLLRSETSVNCPNGCSN